MPPLLNPPRTRHFRERAAERTLAREVEEFVLSFGTDVRAPHGARMLTVVRRELPPDLRESPITRRALDWIVVQGEGGALITCYRRPHAWRTMRRIADRRPGRARRDPR